MGCPAAVHNPTPPPLSASPPPPLRPVPYGLQPPTDCVFPRPLHRGYRLPCRQPLRPPSPSCLACSSALSPAAVTAPDAASPPQQKPRRSRLRCRQLLSLPPRLPPAAAAAPAVSPLPLWESRPGHFPGRRLDVPAASRRCRAGCRLRATPSFTAPPPSTRLRLPPAASTALVAAPPLAGETTAHSLSWPTAAPAEAPLSTALVPAAVACRRSRERYCLCAAHSSTAPPPPRCACGCHQQRSEP